MSDGTYMGFVGVSTGHSSIREVFPAWADTLHLPTRTLIGHDIPLGAAAPVYRSLVQQISQDHLHRGALVTTHKVSVYDAAKDQFDELDDLAVVFGEISSIYKRGSQLCGSAKDPITVRLALEELVPDGHFTATGAEVLCLGSGGSGRALSHQLGVRSDRPARVTCTARSEVKLTHLRDLHERAGLSTSLFRYVVAPNTHDTDALVAALPPGSLVVNATGLGKDRPGSPLSDQVAFPERGLIWDFNYRGSLEFLRQAQRQQHDKDLVVEDGWRYFIHGWTQVIADVFHILMPPETVGELGRVAAAVR
jgi:shikimate dehydrogenase